MTAAVRVLPTPRPTRDPRPALAVGLGLWALSLASIAAGVFLVGVAIAKRLWPDPGAVLIAKKVRG